MDDGSTGDAIPTIAWAFMKLVSQTGAANTETEARLQLYTVQDLDRLPADPQRPAIWSQYQASKRVAYPGTLYLTGTRFSASLCRSVSV